MGHLVLLCPLFFRCKRFREVSKAPGAMFPGNMVMGMAPGPPALNGQNGFVMQPGEVNNSWTTGVVKLPSGQLK